jgi:cell division protease FtsH
MVTEYGMSRAVGSIKLGNGSGEPFMGRDMSTGRDYSENIAETVDLETRALLEAAHDEAYQVINDNREILDNLAGLLLEKETLDANELLEIFKDVRKLPERPQWLSSDKRPVSDLPAIAVPAKAPVDEGAVDGGVDSGSAKPRRHRAPRSNPGIAPA